MTKASKHDPALPHRTVRSFVLRAGRLTAGQKRALTELWPEYGVDSGREPLEFSAVFGRSAPVVLEIGFGNGDNLVDMAVRDTESNFLGIEVHEPGVGHCLLGIERHALRNVRVMRDDAVEVLRHRIPDASLSRVNVFFPDPWHKKKHHKRRIIQPAFVDQVARALTPGGMFHVVTDWPDYAEHIAAVMGGRADFEPAEPPQDRIKTRFDKRGQRLGHDNWERAWCRRSKLPKPS